MVLSTSHAAGQTIASADINAIATEVNGHDTTLTGLTVFSGMNYGAGTPANTVGHDGEGYFDRTSGLIWGPKGTPTAGQWASTASDSAVPYLGVGDPRNQGLLGWTLAPEAASSTITLTTNVVILSRFTALTTTTIGHLGYGIGTAGTSLTTGNFVGIYDVGTATAGTYTLLGTSADQSGVWTTTGVYLTALASSVSVAAGQDYMLALQGVFTGTAPHVYCGANVAVTQGLINIGLTTGTTSMRTTKATGGGTALPATIAASATSTQQAALFMAAAA
jgi:hypothetical protein